MKVTAVIPARSGSRRFKNKNVAPFGRVPMLVHKIRQLLAVLAPENILVSSDSAEYLSLAATEKVRTHLRKPIYADDVSVPFAETVRNILHEATDSDVILWAPCTSPLVGPKYYRDALDIFETILTSGSDTYDSVVSFEEFKRFVWDDDGPVNYKLGSGYVTSQNLPPFYFMSDAFMVARREDMISWGHFHGPKPFKVVIPKGVAVDIDDEYDYRCALAYHEHGPLIEERKSWGK